MTAEIYLDGLKPYVVTVYRERQRKRVVACVAVRALSKNHAKEVFRRDHPEHRSKTVRISDA